MYAMGLDATAYPHGPHGGLSWPSAMRSTFTAADDLLRGSEGRAPPLPHQYAPPGKFIFRPRTSRVNWRLLHSLDLDRVIREGDVDMIQAHMENITFARFSREDLEVTSDECIIKVVQLSQLCMEFLMATCSASQHLIQGLTERVRVQAAQLKVADTRRRSERPSRRPPPERAPMPQVFVRKCPHCPKRFQTEQYLYEHMSRRHIADVFEPPPLSNTRLQEKPPEPEPVLSPGRAGLDSSEISEAVKMVVKDATMDLHGSMQQQEGALKSQQRMFEVELQKMQEKMDNMRQDMGKLQTSPPEVIVSPRDEGPSVDLSGLEKHMEKSMMTLRNDLDDRMSKMFDENRQQLNELAKAAASKPPEKDSDDAREFAGAVERQIQQLRQQLSDVQKQLAEEVKAVVATSKETPDKPVAEQAPVAPTPAPQPQPAQPAVPVTPEAPPVQTEPLAPKEPKAPPKAPVQVEDAEEETPPPRFQPPQPIEIDEEPQVPAELGFDWSKVPGPASPSFQKAWKEGIAKCSTDTEKLLFMISMTGERTRPRKPKDGLRELDVTWGGQLSPKDAKRAQEPRLPEPKEEAKDVKVEQPVPKANDPKKPAEKRETILTRRAFASGFTGFLQRCRPDLLEAPESVGQVSQPKSLSALVEAATASQALSTLSPPLPPPQGPPQSGPAASSVAFAPEAKKLLEPKAMPPDPVTQVLQPKTFAATSLPLGAIPPKATPAPAVPAVSAVPPAKPPMASPPPATPPATPLTPAAPASPPAPLKAAALAKSPELASPLSTPQSLSPTPLPSLSSTPLKMAPPAPPPAPSVPPPKAPKAPLGAPPGAPPGVPGAPVMPPTPEKLERPVAKPLEPVPEAREYRTESLEATIQRISSLKSSEDMRPFAAPPAPKVGLPVGPPGGPAPGPPKPAVEKPTVPLGGPGSSSKESAGPSQSPREAPGDVSVKSMSDATPANATGGWLQGGAGATGPASLNNTAQSSIKPFSPMSESSDQSFGLDNTWKGPGRDGNAEPSADMAVEEFD